MNLQKKMASNRTCSNVANYHVTTTIGNKLVLPLARNNFKEQSFDLFEVGKYSVFEIANWFLAKSSMSHLKLQKLCYYAQAWFYTVNNRRLMDTDFQAWVHGPVSPALYERFKDFGYNIINIVGEYHTCIEKEDLAILEKVWKKYSSYSASELEIMTHEELPWIEARTGYADSERCQVVILPKTMKVYYSSKNVKVDKK